MNLRALACLLESEPRYQRLRKSLGRLPVREKAHVLKNALPFTLTVLCRQLEVPVLILTPKPEDARLMHEQLLLWSGGDENVLHFPEIETLPFERLVTDADTSHGRICALAALTYSCRPSTIVVASATAVIQKTIDRSTFISSTHTLSSNQRVIMRDLLEKWRHLGYRFDSAVHAPGSASRRGGILDIYPIDSHMPVRIELWGDEIHSIRQFDPVTQRSTVMVDSVTILPAQEALPALMDSEQRGNLFASLDMSNCTETTRARIEEEVSLLTDGFEVEEDGFYSGFFNHGSLLEYFPNDGLLVLDSPQEVKEAAWEAQRRVDTLQQVKEQRGDLPRGFPLSYIHSQRIEEQVAGVQRHLQVLPWGPGDVTHLDRDVLPFTSSPVFLGKLDSFVEEAEEMVQSGHRVVAVTSHSKRLGEILSTHDVNANVVTTLDKVPPLGSITVIQSEGTGLTGGLVLLLEGQRTAIFADPEIFGVVKQRRPIRRTSVSRNKFLSELSPGGYVVHVEHGIGKFIGTGRRPANAHEQDTEYLIIQYAQSDKLYVPMEHLARVTPYVAPMDHPPVLTRLGTVEWKRAKERVERSAREMAAELLSLYAARQMVKGHAVSPDVPWQVELEESFPFEETPDQLATIADVKADMESNKPMDRLICGDVGYGKTEVALRAAFKAVAGGQQAAVLVPTTLLAQQHYVTFSQRLSPYPITVEVLSRFRTGKEQREILEGLANGRIDICIGTHRLIQGDVGFKDLGLVVIDEEQRFGVAHKERLRQMRKEVDVLTMTATPIPRTLHMSLAGVRDMSTMETPPEERLPIKTYVSEFSDELLREAIMRELDRQGQIYFLHNRVKTIDYMANYVSLLLPEARVGIAHGQMAEGMLEQTMIDFSEGKIDVLICTTIIESGLDIPNVNTMIVNRSDTFGLAQLYQLRGRIGRSARRAYAYLLVPGPHSLTEAAQRRHRVMLEATELGAGFRIAMKDLEIRGAGNILGAEQSGHIQAVGFDLYNQLLSIAVEQLRAQLLVGDVGSGIDGKTEDHQIDDVSERMSGSFVAVDLGIPASIPQEYVSDLSTRLGIYHKLISLKDPREVEDMGTELRDRFGPQPWQVVNLLYVSRLRLEAQRAGIETIAKEAERIILRLGDEIGGGRRALQKLLGNDVEVGNTQVRLILSKPNDCWQQHLMDKVEKLAGFRERSDRLVSYVRMREAESS